jgi:hypothetical protein
MEKKSSRKSEGSKRATSGSAKSLAIAKRGIKTSHDFANFMGALMSDLIEGTVVSGTANAVCNAGGKLLKVVELQYRYGEPKGAGQGPKTLQLTVETPQLEASVK